MLFLSSICNDQTFDANGDPLVGGQIETYLAGSSTPAATYTDDTGGTPQSNPIILNSLGYPTLGDIWLTGGVSYKFIIKNAAGSTLRTIDNISGINDASVSQSEWVESGFVPTFIDATNFSVPGDQTAVLQINRRTRTTNTSGFIYSTITNSVFAAGITTVTLVNDSGVLDAGLSAVAYGLLSADDPAIPEIPVPATRITGQVAIANGGTGQATALAGFDALKQSATSSYAGVSELADATEFNTGTDTTRVPPVSVIRENMMLRGTPVTFTTQTAIDFAAPGWVNEIKISIVGMSTNGTSIPLVQLVDSGGPAAAGYLGSVSTGASSINFGTGFALAQSWAAASVVHGTVTLTRLNAAGTVWTVEGGIGSSNAASNQSIGGSKTLSNQLTGIRLTTVNGTDQFDNTGSGQFNVVMS